MKKKSLMYGLLCGIGGIMIGYFASKLDTVLGCILFILGVLLIIVSSLKMNN